MISCLRILSDEPDSGERDGLIGCLLSRLMCVIVTGSAACLTLINPQRARALSFVCTIRFIRSVTGFQQQVRGSVRADRCARISPGGSAPGAG